MSSGTYYSMIRTKDHKFDLRRVNLALHSLSAFLAPGFEASVPGSTTLIVLDVPRVTALPLVQMRHR